MVKGPLGEQIHREGWRGTGSWVGGQGSWTETRRMQVLWG